MATSGFPWHLQKSDRKSGELSEKPDKLTDSNSNSTLTRALNDATNAKTSSAPISDNRQRHQGSISKHRSGSLKKPPIGRPQIRFAEPQRKEQSNKPASRIPVRTIPPWIQDADEDDVLEASHLLPTGPDGALIASHNYLPSTQQRPLLSGGYPLSSGEVRSAPTSRWVSFARASAYPRENFNSEKVDADWLNKNFTDYSKPWLADHNDDDVEDGSDKYRAFRRKRRAWYERLHFAIMRNPFIPLFFRVFVIAFAATAMALGASILHENHIIERCLDQEAAVRSVACQAKIGNTDARIDYEREDPSALMAIIVDAVAIIYSVYITYDEYFSKPLGLRPAAAKVRLVLLDLFFIVFQSANLSLAFNSITVIEGPCQIGEQPGTDVRFDQVCSRGRALSSVLLISLLAWMLTFSVSILRYVDKFKLGPSADKLQTR